MLFNLFQVEKAIDDAVPPLVLILVFGAIEEAVTEFNFQPMIEMADILFGDLFD